MQHYNTLLETAAPGKGFDFLPLLLIFVVFFFFIIWPQMRKQKKAKAYLAEIKKGDYIVTTGGIHGKINSIGDTYLVVEMEEGKAKIEKTAISMEMTMAAYKPKAEEASK
jgi:preprotein translocase subunit YajC